MSSEWGEYRPRKINTKAESDLDFRLARHAQEIACEDAAMGYQTETSAYWQEHPGVTYGDVLRERAAGNVRPAWAIVRQPTNYRRLARLAPSAAGRAYWADKAAIVA